MKNLKLEVMKKINLPVEIIENVIDTAESYSGVPNKVGELVGIVLMHLDLYMFQYMRIQNLSSQELLKIWLGTEKYTKKNKLKRGGFSILF